MLTAKSFNRWERGGRPRLQNIAADAAESVIVNRKMLGPTGGPVRIINSAVAEPGTMVQSEASELHPVTESIRSGDLLNAYDSIVVTSRGC